MSLLKNLIHIGLNEYIVYFSNMNARCIKHADVVALFEPLFSNEKSSVMLDVCDAVFVQKGLSFL